VTEAKQIRVARRGRLFPEIQWSPEKIAQKKAEDSAIYQRCKAIFSRVQPELIKTHYNWFIAIAPERGEYFIERDEELATQMVHQKYPKAIPFLFKINETGVSGTI